MALTVLIRNLLLSGVSHSSRLVVNTILYIFIARNYGAEGFGAFTTAHAYYGFFLLIADFGIDTYVLTLAANRSPSSNATVAELFGIKLAFVVLSALMMVCVVSLSGFRHETNTFLLLMTVALIGSALTTFLLSMLKSLEIFGPDAAVNLLQNGILLLAIIIVWLFKLGLSSLLIAFVISRYLGLPLVFKDISQKFPQVSASIFTIWQRHGKAVLTYGLHLLFGTLFFISDSLLIPLFYDEYMTGAYQAVFKLAVLVLLFSDIVTMTYLPTLSRLFEEDRRKWAEFSLFLHKIISLTGVFGGALFYFYAEELLTLVYGGVQYHESIFLMRVFALVIMVRCLSIVHGFMLTSSAMQTVRMRITFYASIVNVTGNIMVLPHYGIEGAAIVSLCTNLLVAVLFVYHTRGHQSHRDHRFTIMMTCAVVCIIVAMLAPLPSFPTAPIFILVYTILGIAWGFRDHELEYIRTVTSGVLHRIQWGGRA